MKKIFLYVMAAMYTGLGIFHFVAPEKYLPLMAAWLPAHLLLIYISGFAEIALGILVAVRQTRRVAAYLIIAMLIFFLFLIHIPHTMDLYARHEKGFIINLIRTPLQFLLIAWAWLYARKQNNAANL
jgi:uncharacterized membrane protein